MSDFGVMLKSYAPDFDYAKRFIESFRVFATEAIPLYIVVPDQDIQLFTEFVADTGQVLPESLWAEHLVDYPLHGNSPGYINQEIIKLAFAEKNFLANYLCADSEAVFIRPFSKADFMADPTTPFTFVTEDHELQVDPIYFARYGKARNQSLRHMREYLQLPMDRYETCHNMAVFSGEVLRSLRGYMSDQGLTYADLIEISPYEFSWYNFWLEKSGAIPRVVREPVFDLIHSDQQQFGYTLKGVQLQDLARGYVGIVTNYQITRFQGVRDYEANLVATLARTLNYSELCSAIVEKIMQRFPRIRGMMGNRI